MLSNMFQVYMAILYNYGDQNLIKLSIIDNILWKIPCQSYRVGSYSGSGNYLSGYHVIMDHYSI
jgi:hypothetical protein